MPSNLIFSTFSHFNALQQRRNENILENANSERFKINRNVVIIIKKKVGRSFTATTSLLSLSHIHHTKWQSIKIFYKWCKERRKLIPWEIHHHYAGLECVCNHVIMCTRINCIFPHSHLQNWLLYGVISMFPR